MSLAIPLLLALATADTSPATEPEVSDWTHTLRAGIVTTTATHTESQRVFAHSPSNFTMTGFVAQYVVQRGHDHVRWHSIFSLELGKADHDPQLVGALFVGTGFRVDSSPHADLAAIFELDGTLGASSTSHVGLLGLHVAMGARISPRWEVLVSAEADDVDLPTQGYFNVLFNGHASIGVSAGYAF